MTQRITDPGIYTMRPELYHADPCVVPSLSSGIAATIVTDTLADAAFRHPRLNADHQEDDSTRYDLGSVAHELVLGKGAGIVVIDADDWRTADAKRQRAEALEAKLQPCLRKVYDKALAMREALLAQLAQDADNADAFRDGLAEQVAVAKLPTANGPVYCRTMMDWRMTSRPAIYDYKTFAPGADPDGFVKYLFREGRDIQDPFYSKVLAALLGLDWREVDFRFVVQNPEPPFTAAVIQLDDQARQFAGERAAWAIERWGWATHAGEWPGYRARTHYVAAPAYEFTAWAAKLMAEEMADQLDARAAA